MSPPERHVMAFSRLGAPIASSLPIQPRRWTFTLARNRIDPKQPDTAVISGEGVLPPIKLGQTFTEAITGFEWRVVGQERIGW